MSCCLIYISVHCFNNSTRKFFRLDSTRLDSFLQLCEETLQSGLHRKKGNFEYTVFFIYNIILVNQLSYVFICTRSLIFRHEYSFINDILIKI